MSLQFVDLKDPSIQYVNPFNGERGTKALSEIEHPVMFLTATNPKKSVYDVNELIQLFNVGEILDEIRDRTIIPIFTTNDHGLKYFETLEILKSNGIIPADTFPDDVKEEIKQVPNAQSAPLPPKRAYSPRTREVTSLPPPPQPKLGKPPLVTLNTPTPSASHPADLTAFREALNDGKKQAVYSRNSMEPVGRPFAHPLPHYLLQASTFSGYSMPPPRMPDYPQAPTFSGPYHSPLVQRMPNAPPSAQPSRRDPFAILPPELSMDPEIRHIINNNGSYVPMNIDTIKLILNNRSFYDTIGRHGLYITHIH